MSSQDLRNQRFKRTSAADPSSLDEDMQAVLDQWDGRATLAEVERHLELSPEELFDITGKLLAGGLIEPIIASEPVVSQEFIRRVIAELAIAIGPIAEIIVEDTIADLGFAPERLPKSRMAELLDALCAEIKREERRRAFEHAMFEALKEA